MRRRGICDRAILKLLLQDITRALCVCTYASGASSSYINTLIRDIVRTSASIVKGTRGFEENIRNSAPRRKVRCSPTARHKKVKARMETHRRDAEIRRIHSALCSENMRRSYVFKKKRPAMDRHRSRRIALIGRVTCKPPEEHDMSQVLSFVT